MPFVNSPRVQGPTFGTPPQGPQQVPQVRPSPTFTGQPEDPNRVQRLLQFLGTPGGGAITDMLGAGISAYGQHQQNQANLNQNQRQFDQQHSLNRANSVLTANPLGANQEFAQRNALLAAILPALQNQRSTPGDPGVAAAMGSRVGGFRLPEGGLDPALIERLYGQAATQASIDQRMADIGAINGQRPGVQSNAQSPAGAAPRSALDVMRNIMQRGNIDRAEWEAANGPLPPDYEWDMENRQPKKKGSGFLGMLGKGLAIGGAGLATALTGGGASPLLGAAIGAGSGALGSALSGGNPLMGAISGGAGPYVNQATNSLGRAILGRR